MSDYVTVIYGKNSSYNVSKVALKELVYKAIKNTKGTTKNGQVNIFINESKSNSSVVAGILIKKSYDVFKTLTSLKKEIKEYYKNMIDSHPLNIQLIYKGSN